MPEPQDGKRDSAGAEPIYTAEEVKPPELEANSFGGGLDAADSPPSAPDEPGTGSAHEDEGWRGIETRP